MLTIIGTGHAGYTLAREFRRLNPDAPLRLISQDGGESYYKPDLSKSAAKDPESLIKAPFEAQASALNADILVRSKVISLQPQDRTLTLEKGEVLAYSTLVLATGASPLPMPFPALRVNNLDDYRAFRAGLQAGQAITILGAGLIGCEFAHDLASSGYQVSVVELADRPLAALLSPELSHALRLALEALGVSFYLGQKAVSAAQNHVTLDSGTSLTGTVLAAVGLRGNVELAAAAGLNTGVGVVVNEYLQSSDPNIYALGDCVQWPDVQRLRPYILPIASAARNLAQTLNGQPTPTVLPAQPVLVKTPSLPLWVCGAAVPTVWHSEGAGQDWVAKAFDDAGDLRGFAVSGACVPQKNELAKQVKI